jgi:TetR/AcrR family transcriptional repressor of multidrug resistance operon
MRPRDENKLLLLKEKAIEIMVNEGFEGLSMHKLAKAAEISPATIYIYYASREEMVNSLHSEVMEVFSRTVLKNFSPEMDLREGLWIQWKNRTEFALTYPLYYNFLQQFRNSTLVRCDHSEFINNMRAFVHHAIERGEMPEMQAEVFWSLAYGPLNALLDFHFNKKSISPASFQLTEDILKSTFERCILSLNSPTL